MLYDVISAVNNKLKGRLGIDENEGDQNENKQYYSN